MVAEHLKTVVNMQFEGSATKEEESVKNRDKNTCMRPPYFL